MQRRCSEISCIWIFCFYIYSPVPALVEQIAAKETFAAVFKNCIKLENKKNDVLSGIYWCLVTAIYLARSFLTGAWGRTWIIWPVAGVLFAAVIGMANVRRERRRTY